MEDEPRISKQKPTPPNSSRGSEKFNIYGSMICFTGAMLGGNLTEGVTRLILSNNNFSVEQIHNYSDIAFVPGAVVFGLLIPIEISRRANHRTWSETLNRIIKIR